MQQQRRHAGACLHFAQARDHRFGRSVQQRGVEQVVVGKRAALLRHRPEIARRAGAPEVGDVAHDRLFGVDAGLRVGIGDIDPACDVDLAGCRILCALGRCFREFAFVERSLRCQCLHAGQGREHQAKAAAPAVADRAIGAAGHVQRRMRHLHGMRQHLVGLGDGAAEILSLVVVAMAVEGVEHQADRLLDHVAAALEILAQSHELVGPVTRADAQHDTAVGEYVDEARVLDDADRVVER